MTTIAKPRLRGLLLSKLRVQIPIALTFALSCGFAMKVFFRDERRNKINEFYRNYDVQKEGARLRELGVFKRTKDL